MFNQVHRNFYLKIIDPAKNLVEMIILGVMVNNWQNL